MMLALRRPNCLELIVGRMPTKPFKDSMVMAMTISFCMWSGHNLGLSVRILDLFLFACYTDYFVLQCMGLLLSNQKSRGNLC